MPSTKEQFIRFAAGGAVGTACHYAVLMAWVEILGAPVVLGALVGFAAGALVNYAIARRFVFATRRSHGSALPRFALVAVAGAVLNTMIVALAYGAGVHYLVAQLLATLVVLVWNFLANKHWTFPE